MKENEFIFDSVDLLLYESHILSLICCGLYVNSSKWLEKQKSINKS